MEVQQSDERAQDVSPERPATGGSLPLVLWPWIAVSAGVGLTAAGAFTDSAYLQGVLVNLGVGIGLIGLAGLRLITRNQVAIFLAISVTFSAGIMLGRFLRFEVRAPEFPIRSGVGTVANFTLGSGGPARNAFGLQFSMFSDSTWNLESKVWFKRVSDPNRPGDGYLRAHYELIPMGDHETYVGIYTDFSLPPPQALDISAFRRLAMRLRLGRPLADSPIRVSAVLYSANMHDVDYIFPTFEVPDGLLKPEWQDVSMPFDEFRNPSISAAQVVLDKRQVYRFALLIRGLPTREASGYVDVDDIRFE